MCGIRYREKKCSVFKGLSVSISVAAQMQFRCKKTIFRCSADAVKTPLYFAHKSPVCRYSQWFEGKLVSG